MVDFGSQPSVILFVLENGFRKAGFSLGDSVFGIHRGTEGIKGE
jgi:hypothetical protein